MIRVASNACGYSGYQCRKFASLPAIFSSGVMHCSGAYTTDPAAFYNYGNIPTQAKGFVMQQPGTLAGGMQIPTSKVPELTCSVDTDPFVTSGGYWNMYDEFKTAKLWWGREYMENGAMITDSKGWLSGGLLCFSAGTTGYTITPGILEPMVNTQFDPISIDAITNTDASIDGIMLTLMMITKWRKIIEARLNDLALRPTGGGGGTYYLDDHVAKGLRNLLIATNRNTECADFKIEHTWGNILYESGATHTAPEYKLHGGTVTINGSTITKTLSSSSITCVGAYTSGFTAFMVFSGINLLENRGTVISGCWLSVGTPGTLPTRTQTMVTVPYGGVQLIGGTATQGEGGATENASTFYMYKIWQADCPTNINITRFSSAGVVYYTGSAVDVPYITLPTAECSGGAAN